MSGPLRADAVVLLTGAGGFLGRACLEHLAGSEASLHAVSRHARPREGRVCWHQADLRDPDVAVALARAVRPTHLLHLAWTTAPGLFWSDPANRDWLAAGRALVAACAAGPLARFVGAGTCAEYDGTHRDFVEDRTPIRPATPYGQAKAALWAAAASACADSGASAAWGRVFLPYGPGDSPKRLVPSLVERLLAGETMALGPGTQERDFIHRDDVGEAFVRLLAGSAEGAFNVGTGRGTTVRAVCEHVAGRLGRPDLLRFGSRPPPVEEPDRLVADKAKLARALGWTPSIAWEDGIDRTVDGLLRTPTSSS